MTEFKYVATTKNGQKVTGTKEAENRSDVAGFLHDQNMIVISINESIGIDFKRLTSLQIGGVPLKERLIFVKQFSTMLTAGLPILQALDILVQQTVNSSLKSKLETVYKAIESGSSLSEAFKREKSIFTDLQISLIVAGEKSGTLNQIMLRIADDMEKSRQLRSKIIGAMIYPVIILVVMVAVLILMLIFMVPSVKDLYADFGVTDLPAITQFFVNLSSLFTNPFGLVIMGVLLVSGIFGLRYYRGTPGGLRVTDKLLLRAPVFGQLLVKAQLAQFCRLLSLLLESGVPIVEALRTIANSMSNVLFKEVIVNASGEVLKGNPLSVELSKGNVFPLVLLKMIATGEETGKLDKVSFDMAKFYESEVEEVTSNLTKLMEPFILLMVGGVVGFLAVAIYLPLYTIGQYIK